MATTTSTTGGDLKDAYIQSLVTSLLHANELHNKKISEKDAELDELRQRLTRLEEENADLKTQLQDRDVQQGEQTQLALVFDGDKRVSVSTPTTAVPRSNRSLTSSPAKIATSRDSAALAAENASSPYPAIGAGVEREDPGTQLITTSPQPKITTLTFFDQVCQPETQHAHYWDASRGPLCDVHNSLVRLLCHVCQRYFSFSNGGSNDNNRAGHNEQFQDHLEIAHPRLAALRNQPLEEYDRTRLGVAPRPVKPPPMIVHYQLGQSSVATVSGAGGVSREGVDPEKEENLGLESASRRRRSGRGAPLPQTENKTKTSTDVAIGNPAAIDNPADAESSSTSMDYQLSGTQPVTDGVPLWKVIQKAYPGQLSNMRPRDRDYLIELTRSYLVEQLGESVVEAQCVVIGQKGGKKITIPGRLVPEFQRWFDEKLKEGIFAAGNDPSSSVRNKRPRHSAGKEEDIDAKRSRPRLQDGVEEEVSLSPPVMEDVTPVSPLTVALDSAGDSSSGSDIPSSTPQQQLDLASRRRSSTGEKYVSWTEIVRPECGRWEGATPHMSNFVKSFLSMHGAEEKQVVPDIPGVSRLRKSIGIPPHLKEDFLKSFKSRFPAPFKKKAVKKGKTLTSNDTIATSTTVQPSSSSSSLSFVMPTLGGEGGSRSSAAGSSESDAAKTSLIAEKIKSIRVRLRKPVIEETDKAPTNPPPTTTQPVTAPAPPPKSPTKSKKKRNYNKNVEVWTNVVRAIAPDYLDQRCDPNLKVRISHGVKCFLDAEAPTVGLKAEECMASYGRGRPTYGIPKALRGEFEVWFRKNMNNGFDEYLGNGSGVRSSAQQQQKRTLDEEQPQKKRQPRQQSRDVVRPNNGDGDGTGNDILGRFNSRVRIVLRSSSSSTLASSSSSGGQASGSSSAPPINRVKIANVQPLAPSEEVPDEDSGNDNIDRDAPATQSDALTEEEEEHTMITTRSPSPPSQQNEAVDTDAFNAGADVDLSQSEESQKQQFDSFVSAVLQFCPSPGPIDKSFDVNGVGVAEASMSVGEILGGINAGEVAPANEESKSVDRMECDEDVPVGRSDETANKTFDELTEVIDTVQAVVHHEGEECGGGGSRSQVRVLEEPKSSFVVNVDQPMTGVVASGSKAPSTAHKREAEQKKPTLMQYNTKPSNERIALKNMTKQFLKREAEDFNECIIIAVKHVGGEGTGADGPSTTGEQPSGGSTKILRTYGIPLHLQERYTQFIRENYTNSLVPPSSSSSSSFNPNSNSILHPTSTLTSMSANSLTTSASSSMVFNGSGVGGEANASGGAAELVNATSIAVATGITPPVSYAAVSPPVPMGVG
ncbi:hypothetical protein HK102_000913, partial [Quaeritorhiza haematococci]